MSTPLPPRRPLADLHAAGVDALVDALGIADAARFLQQAGPHLGDYTAERDTLTEDITLEDVLRLVQEDARGRLGAEEQVNEPAR